MVLDRVFAAARDDHDPLDPGVARLLDDVLDEGPVDQGQHLLGLGLGGRQEARTQARGGENGDANSWTCDRSVAERPAGPAAPEPVQ